MFYTHKNIIKKSKINANIIFYVLSRCYSIKTKFYLYKYLNIENLQIRDSRTCAHYYHIIIVSSSDEIQLTDS